MDGLPGESADIIRTPTEDEKQDFVPIITPKGKVLSPTDKFHAKCATEEQKARKRIFKDKPWLGQGIYRE